MKLYEVAAKYNADIARMQDLDLPSEVVLDTVDGMQGEVTEKIKAVVCVGLNMKALGNARIEAGKRMVESGQAELNRGDSLFSYAQISISNCGLPMPLKFVEFNVNLQRNPPSCDVSDPEKLPAHLRSTEVTFRISGDPAAFVSSVNSLALADANIVLLETSLSVKVDKRAVLDALKDIDAANKAKGVGEERDRLPGARMNPTAYRLTVK